MSKFDYEKKCPDCGFYSMDYNFTEQSWECHSCGLIQPEAQPDALVMPEVLVIA